MKPVLPSLPSLPTLNAPASKPGAMPALAPLPKMKTLAELELEATNPLDRNNERYTGDAEHDALLDMEVIEDEFAAIHAARKQQAEAVELANDSEFWFCMYFQTREQKEAFVKHFGFATDKYIDGQEAARQLGIELPARPAPYKVGRIDAKLAKLTE